MRWVKADNSISFGEGLLSRAALTLEEIINPKRVSPKSIQGLEEALDLITNCIMEKMDITIVGDYDADGLTSTAILTKLLRFMGADPEYIIPKRMTEGYGVSLDIIERIKPGLIVTVDNGIAANEAIERAKWLGSFVLIMDHHLPGESVPAADVVVDPHVDPENNGFVDYCGAGLALKLAELYLLGEGKRAGSAELLMDLYVLGAIGTVADMMPLLGDNRFIVMKGLSLINSRMGELSCSLQALFASAGAELYDEETISFKVAPMLNAPGRLYNAGGTSVMKLLLCEDSAEAETYVSKLSQINDRRKADTDKYFVDVCQTVLLQKLDTATPMCIVVNDIPEGLVGLVTGKLAEKYKKPCFVFTESNEKGILKGSGRSYGSFNLEPMIRAVQPVIEQGGGHEGAAGLSVARERYEEMVQIMRKYAADYTEQDTDVLVYDMEIKEEKVPAMLSAVKKFAPFGQGWPKPVFVVKDFEPSGNGGQHFRFVGSERQHLQLRGKEMSAIGFSMAEAYAVLNAPTKVDVLGTLQENWFRGVMTPQLMIEDIRLPESTHSAQQEQH